MDISVMARDLENVIMEKLTPWGFKELPDKFPKQLYKKILWYLNQFQSHLKFWMFQEMISLVVTQWMDSWLKIELMTHFKCLQSI